MLLHHFSKALMWLESLKFVPLLCVPDAVVIVFCVSVSRCEILVISCVTLWESWENNLVKNLAEVNFRHLHDNIGVFFFLPKNNIRGHFLNIFSFAARCQGSRQSNAVVTAEFENHNNNSTRKSNITKARNCRNVDQVTSVSPASRRPCPAEAVAAATPVRYPGGG